MGYFQSIVGYFGVEWLVILGYLAFQEDKKQSVIVNSMVYIYNLWYVAKSQGAT